MIKLNAKSFKLDPRLYMVENGRPVRGKEEIKRYKKRNARREVESYFNNRHNDDWGYGETPRLNTNLTIDKMDEYHPLLNSEAFEEPKVPEKKKVEDITADEVIRNFVADYRDNKMNTAAIKILLVEDFCKVAAIMGFYENPKYEFAVPQMNKLLTLMSTENFAHNLASSIAAGDLEIDATAKYHVLKLFGRLLGYEKVTEAVQNIYIEIITDSLCDLDIRIMAETFGISEETAVDLIVMIPTAVTATQYDSDIRAYAKHFVYVIMEDFQDTITIMDAKRQEELFREIFKDSTGNGVSKALVACFTAYLPEVASDLDEEEFKFKALLLSEYRKMLYEMLNNMDIPSIEAVIKNIGKQLRKMQERNMSLNVVFDVEYVTNNGYENIRKALISYLEARPEMEQYFMIAE